MTWQPDYITAGELAAYCKADAVADADPLAAAVTAASREVDKFCHRQFGSSDPGTVRYYDARWSDFRCGFIADVDDLQAVPAEVAVDDGSGTYVPLDDEVLLLPRNAVEDGLAFTRLQLPAAVTCIARRDAVKVTAPATGFGWPAFPAAVSQATMLQASRIFARRDSPFGIAGSPDMGNELRLLAKIDPDAFMALLFYVRKQKGLR